MSKFTLTIETNNAEIENLGDEVARILSYVGDEFRWAGTTNAPVLIRDANGNFEGHYEYTD